MSAYIKTTIIFIILLHHYTTAKPLYTYWDNIHIKQKDLWYVKSGERLLKIEFDNIEIKFIDNVSKLQKDSMLLALNCSIQNVDSRNKYYVKIASGTEYFYFLRELLYSRSIQNISVKTTGGNRLVDSLVTEIRLRDKIFINKEGKWYLSMVGVLHEIAPDALSLRFKKDVSEKNRNALLERNNLQVIDKNRLEIYDAKILSARHAIFCFIELYQNPLLDFIEMNIKGNY